MASITLEFAQFGHFDSFEIIRSLTSMASTPDSALPAPIATGLQTMYYADTTVVDGSTYYYKVRVWRGPESLVSDEVMVRAMQDEYLLDMPFSTDIHDHGKFNLTATAVGSPVIQGGYLYVPANSYLSFNTTGLTELNLGTTDFEFGVEVALMPSGGALYPCVFGVGSLWEAGAISMQFNPSSVFMCAIRNPSEKDAFSPSSQVRDGSTFVKYVIRRIGGVWTTYKNDVAGTPLTDNTFIANFTKNGVITIGAAVWQLGSTASHSKIKNVYLKRL